MPKKDILSKYDDNTDNKILVYLRRHYPVFTIDIDNEFLNGKHRILVDDKTYFVENNKKSLVNRIYNDMVDEFPSYDEKLLRRTIKKFLDLIITN